MMMDKRLLSTVPESRKYIAANVALQWLALAANIGLVTAVCRLLARLWAGTAVPGDLAVTAGLAVLALAVRFGCAVGAARMSYLSSRTVKARLRGMIYEKLLRLGSAYRESVRTSEVVQVAVEGVDFAYDEARPILQNVTMAFPRGSFTALVGESGCGKSTVAALLTGRRHARAGRITLGGVPLAELDEAGLAGAVTYLSHNSYLFKGTVRDNLRMAALEADDAALWAVLEQVRLADFLRAEQGLDTPLLEKASNLSGGQCQRLALARALLHDSPVYLFDEATSNIDVESENDIMALIRTLACTKTVILISHRLANVTAADRICLLQDGRVAEAGTHTALLEKGGAYAKLWNAQQQLEHYTKQEVSA